MFDAPSSRHPDPPPPGPPPELRFLKLLVAALAGVMIVGLVVIVAALVIRIGQEPAPLAVPEVITLPDGARADAVTRGRGWIAVVTDGDEILIYDAEDGTLRQRVAVE